MKPIKLTLIISSLFIGLMSCTTNKKFADFEAQQANLIQETKYDIIRSDSYSLVSYARKGNFIYFKLQYGGGCGTTDFKLLQNKVDPTKARLILKKNDNCKALKYVEHVFELNEIKNSKNVTVVLSNGEQLVIKHKDDTRKKDSK